MFQNATNHQLVVHQLLLFISWYRNPSVQYHIVEVVWHVRRILSFTKVGFFALLSQSVSKVKEESYQKIDAGRTDFAIQDWQENAENLTDRQFAFADIIEPAFLSLLQERLNILHNLGCQSLTYQLYGAILIPLGIVFFHDVPQPFQRIRIRVWINVILFILYLFTDGNLRRWWFSLIFVVSFTLLLSTFLFSQLF